MAYDPMIIDPNKLLIYEASGSGNIAETFPPAHARPSWRFLVAFARIHFADIKDGALATEVLATLTARANGDPDQSTAGPHDTELWDFGKMGFGFDLSMAITPDEVARWTIRRYFGVRFEWTNPQNGDIAWGFEIGLLPLDTPDGSL